MARRESEPEPDLDPLKGGLKHNPFAALRASGTPSAPQPPAQPAASTQKEETRASSVAERVTVRIERSGRGGKTVTIAEGPGLAGRDLDAFAREVSRALGVGARVEDGLLVVQGDQRERVCLWLESRQFRGVVRGN